MRPVLAAEESLLNVELVEHKEGVLTEYLEDSALLATELGVDATTAMEELLDRDEELIVLGALLDPEARGPYCRVMAASWRDRSLAWLVRFWIVLPGRWRARFRACCWAMAAASLVAAAACALSCCCTPGSASLSELLPELASEEDEDMAKRPQLIDAQNKARIAMQRQNQRREKARLGSTSLIYHAPSTSMRLCVCSLIRQGYCKQTSRGQ